MQAIFACLQGAHFRSLQPCGPQSGAEGTHAMCPSQTWQRLQAAVNAWRQPRCLHQA